MTIKILLSKPVTKNFLELSSQFAGVRKRAGRGQGQVLISAPILISETNVTNMNIVLSRADIGVTLSRS